MKHPPHPQPPLYRKLAVPFFGMALLLLTIVFYVFFSWATITIIPKPYIFEQNLSLSLSQSPEDIQGFIVQKIAQGKGIFSASGTARKEGKAHGILTVINRSGRDQPLRETTRFIAPNGFLFRSESSALVPAGGEADIPVIADAPGTVERKTFDSIIFRLPGLREENQKFIFGSKLSLRDQGSSDIKIITQEDRDSATASIIEKLKDKHRTLLLTQAAQRFSLPALALSEGKPSVSMDKKVGDIAEQFELTVLFDFTAVVYDALDLREKVRSSLQKTVGAGLSIAPLGQSDIVVSAREAHNDAQRALFDISVRAQKIRSSDTQSVPREKLSGLTAEQLRNFFLAADDIREVHVSFYPFWVTRAPLLLDHINILVKDPRSLTQ